MKIIVTGGAGFIGSHLVERLASDRHNNIVVIDNLHRGCIEHIPLNRRVTFSKADIRDRSVLVEAFRGCDVVFHLAAQSNVLGAVADMEYSFTSNVVGTFHVLEAAKCAGVRRVVFTSSREVYGDPDETPVQETAPLRPKNAYGASKAAAELYCRVRSPVGLEVVILRLANVYGPRDLDRVIPIFVNNALRGQPLTLYGGEQVVDFIWIGVVVEALVRAGFGELIHEPVNVGSGIGLTIEALAKRILKLTASRSPLLISPRREVEVTRFVAGTTRARLLLGIEPQMDPLSHLADLIEWTRLRIPVPTHPQVVSTEVIPKDLPQGYR
jgi:nucleoside-diphosphate-sugar epimerase